MQFIEKIGKRNLILGIFIICVIVISGFYATFSLSTASEGVSIIDGIKTLKFILGESTLENAVIVPGGSSKNIAITISNKETISLKYGIYYSSLDELDDVEIGYHHSTSHLPDGIIGPSEDYIVTVQIENHSIDAKVIAFGIVYGLESGGDLKIEERQHSLKEKWNFPLNEVAKGSYVSYVGSNGCVEEHCDGSNANSFTGKGYCGEETTSFTSSGYRVAYIKNGSAYLISGGAIECVNNEENNSELVSHLDEYAKKYCNVDFAYRGTCNEKSSWAMNANDFYRIIGSYLNENSCFHQEKSKSCGSENELVDIGSYYWISSLINNQLVYYHPKTLFENTTNNLSKGLRPVLRLADSVVVIGGSGTLEDPYQIKNSEVADYEYSIVYFGNGATSGDTPTSTHKTNTLKKLNKNEFTLTYHVNLDEFAEFDDSYCDETGCHETSIHLESQGEAKFLGWSLEEDGEVPMYMDEAEVINLSTSSSDVVVNLYAVWDYAIFKLPQIQEREGYEILGWYSSKEGGEKIGNPGDKYTDIGKVTLYARWQEKTS